MTPTDCNSQPGPENGIEAALDQQHRVTKEGIMSKFLFTSRSSACSPFVLVCAAMLALAPGSTSAQDQSAPLTVEADDFLEWDQTDGIYTAKGNAVAVQGDARIRGDLLVATYDPNAEDANIETITASGRVDFKDDKSSASGSKLIYNLATSDYRVEGPKASVSGPRGTIQADSSIDLDTQSDETQRMTASGDAIYRDDSGRVFAGDRIVAFFAADGSLSSLDAKGDVSVISGNGRQATGDAATYDADAEAATVTGNVEIIDGANRMRGGRAEVDLKTGNSRMLSSGAGGRVSGVLVTN